MNYGIQEVAEMTIKKIRITKQAPEEVHEVTAIQKRMDDVFWHPKSAEELRKDQDVKPFDFSKAGENWPEDADFEEFKTAINSGRKYPREW
jgi:hypothetical protein